MVKCDYLKTCESIVERYAFCLAKDLPMLVVSPYLVEELRKTSPSVIPSLDHRTNSIKGALSERRSALILLAVRSFLSDDVPIR